MSAAWERYIVSGQDSVRAAGDQWSYPSSLHISIQPSNREVDSFLYCGRPPHARGENRNRTASGQWPPGIHIHQLAIAVYMYL